MLTCFASNPNSSPNPQGLTVLVPLSNIKKGRNIPIKGRIDHSRYHPVSEYTNTLHFQILSDQPERNYPLPECWNKTLTIFTDHRLSERFVSRHSLSFIFIVNHNLKCSKYQLVMTTIFSSFNIDIF